MSKETERILLEISNLAIGKLPKMPVQYGNYIWNAFRLGEEYAKLTAVNPPASNTMLSQIERKIESARQLGKKVKRIHITKEVHQLLREELRMVTSPYNTTLELDGYRLKVYSQCMNVDWWLEFEPVPGMHHDGYPCKHAFTFDGL